MCVSLPVCVAIWPLTRCKSLRSQNIGSGESVERFIQWLYHYYVPRREIPSLIRQLLLLRCTCLHCSHSNGKLKFRLNDCLSKSHICNRLAKRSATTTTNPLWFFLPFFIFHLNIVTLMLHIQMTTSIDVHRMLSQKKSSSLSLSSHYTFFLQH